MSKWQIKYNMKISKNRKFEYNITYIYNTYNIIYIIIVQNARILWSKVLPDPTKGPRSAIYIFTRQYKMSTLCILNSGPYKVTVYLNYDLPKYFEFHDTWLFIRKSFGTYYSYIGEVTKSRRSGPRSRTKI